jgi:hypothetical protein
MGRRRPQPLAPPTMEERAEAARAARALVAAIADPSLKGEPQTYHLDLSNPRRGLWVTKWSGVPGFAKVNGRFEHDCLPGWSYARNEVRREMIPDLELLAEKGIRPTEVTSK